MKLSFITPTSYIKQFGSQSDFILALSHLIDLENENEYEKAIKATNLPIICDNGLFENKVPENTESLLQKALQIGAKTVFIPDHLYNMVETEKELLKSAELFLSHGIKVAVVVQADNEKDYLEFYDRLVADKRVSLIGISILAVPKCFGGSIVGSRIRLLKTLLERGGNTKDLHFLGMGEGAEDLLFAKRNCPFVVSHDSSSAFWNAINSKKIVKSMHDDLRVEGGKTTVSVNFNFRDANEGQLQRAQENIDLIKQSLQ